MVGSVRGPPVEGHWDRLWTGLKAQDPPTKLQPEAWSLSVGIMFRMIVPNPS